MWRFFQPRRVVTVRSANTNNKKESSPCYHVTAAAATSAAVILTSSMGHTNSICDQQKDLGLGYRKSNHQETFNNTTNTTTTTTSTAKTESSATRRFNSINDIITEQGREKSKTTTNHHNFKKSFIRIGNSIMENASNDNYVKCEEASSPSKPPTNNSDSNITFRQRRLTMNTTGEEDKDGDYINNDNNNNNNNNNTSKQKTKDEKTTKNNITQNHPLHASFDSKQASRMRIMYSTEFEPSEQQNSSIQAIPNNEILNPPFPPHQVGTYSCHGIEPHPYIVYTKGEKAIDQNALSFFDRIFGSKSSTNYSSARVITVSEKKINQDRGHVIYPYGSHDQTALFGVFDGHGECGEMLAEYTMNALCDKLNSHPCCHDDDFKDLDQAFTDIFHEIDEEVKNKDDFKSTHSGSTACVVLLRGDSVWVANVGDSRAVLAQSRRSNSSTSDSSDGPTLTAVDWSEDQNTKDEVEKLRVIQSGGFVTMPQEEGLPSRVWLDEECTQIGLAMSRSIGDHALKNVGVISEPKVYEYKVTDDDEFFIIATDGVWEFISSHEAVTIIQSCFDMGMGASDACEVLIKEAMDKWKEMEGDYRDDITVTVVRLKDLWDQDKE
jgi:protein phosphatase 2C family protein 2/3